MSIQWRKEMAVDDSVIDEDHKLLIEIVNTFEAAISRKLAPETIDQGLKLLKHYTVEHFRREEELQRAAQYPFFVAHAHEHRDVIKKLDAIAAHRQSAATKADIAVVAKEVIDLLKDWLVHHIIQSDMRMRPYVAEMMIHRQSMRSLKHSSNPCAPTQGGTLHAAPLSSAAVKRAPVV